MIAVLAQIIAVSPILNNRDPPMAVTTKVTEATATMWPCTCRSKGEHTDGKSSLSMRIMCHGRDVEAMNTHDVRR